ncbi:MAG: AAA family ATPase [Promethearchaeota archaeon]
MEKRIIKEPVKISTENMAQKSSDLQNILTDLSDVLWSVEDLPKSHLGKNIVLLINKNKHFREVLTENEIVEIEGKRKTYARLKLYDSNKLQELNMYYDCIDRTTLPKIQMDFNTRKNADVKIGDNIKIRKVTCPTAEKIVLVPENFDGIIPDIHSIREILLGRVGRVLAKGDDFWIPSFFKTSSKHSISDLRDFYFTVFFHEPKGFDVLAVIIDRKTEIEIKDIVLTSYEQIFEEKTFLSSVGGLENAKRDLMEVIGVIVNESEFIEKTGLKFPNNILLSGPSGCGKTFLAKAMISEFPVSYFYINGPEIVGKKPQHAPQELKKIFEIAEDAAPSIILIDEVETLAINREDLRFDAIMRNIVTQFLHLLESISGHKVIVIGTTNKPKTIDPAFMMTGRFGKEIKMGPPKTEERKEILKIAAQKINIIDKKNFNVNIIAENTYGFSGCDFNTIFQNAFIEKLKRLGFYDRFLRSKLSYLNLKDKIAINTDDILSILKNKNVKPSMLRSYAIEIPNVTFEDVGGLTEIKRIIRENIITPMRYPKLFKHYGVRSFKGMLIYGPPGCGKTHIVKAIASEADMNFISIKGAEILNHWLGESESAVREIFTRAKAAAPCIIFFDELDAISTRRGVEGNVHSDRVTAQILIELNGIEDRKDVICIGATNRFDIIDPAMYRPGRLYPVINVGLPDAKARKEILKIYTKDKPIADDIDFDGLVEKTDGYNGAIIEELCNQAAIYAIRKYIGKDSEKNLIQTSMQTSLSNIQPISHADFEQALIDLKKRLKKGNNLNLYS